MAQFIICPNPQCGYQGKGKKIGGADGCFFFVLLFFGVAPGILYLLLCGSPEIICPRCGMSIR